MSEIITIVDNNSIIDDVKMHLEKNLDENHDKLSLYYDDTLERVNNE